MQKLELLLIEALRRDALRQEEGRLVEVGKEFDAVEEYRSNNRDEPVSIDLAIALTFWDAWVDQVHHGFQHVFGEQIIQQRHTRATGKGGGELRKPGVKRQG